MRRLISRLHHWIRPSRGPAILMYHRIATPEVDPWGLSVSPERFVEQIQALSEHRTLLSMDAFVQRLQGRRLPVDAVALTFDDGYLDNLLKAKPILESFGVPATVFLTTERIGTNEEFWWDELARMILSRVAPISTSVTVEDADLEIILPPIDRGMESRVTWRAWHQPVTAREKTYRTLWQALQKCAPEDRERVIAQLRRLLGATHPNPEDLPMCAADVRQLVSDRVSVGAHGCTHQPLTSLSELLGLEEIQRSRVEAEVLSALPVTGFTYPYGDRNPQTIDMVRSVGYHWACSTREAIVDPLDADVHDLPRIAVGDWTAGQLLTKMSSVKT